MTDACVIDASVAVKWFIDEDGSDVARDLQALVMYAPAFIIVEVANIMWLKVRRGELTVKGALERLAKMRATPIAMSDDETLIEKALELATTLAHPIYDCLYLVLARARGVPLLTADRRLARVSATSAELRSLVITLDQVAIVNDQLQVRSSTSN